MTMITVTMNDFADRHVIAYDPQSDIIYEWSAVGPGLPERIWKNEHPYVLSFKHSDIVPESLVKWIEKNQDKIIEVAELIRTVQCDEDYQYASDRQLKLMDEFEGAVDAGEIDRYWDAAVWFAGDPPTLEEVEAENWVANEVSAAISQGVVLNTEEVEKYKRDFLDDHS